MEVADHTDEGSGGDSQRPVMNDNVLYHSLRRVGKVKERFWRQQPLSPPTLVDGT